MLAAAAPDSTEPKIGSDLSELDLTAQAELVPEGPATPLELVDGRSSILAPACSSCAHEPRERQQVRALATVRTGSGESRKAERNQLDGGADGTRTRRSRREASGIVKVFLADPVLKACSELPR